MTLKIFGWIGKRHLEQREVTIDEALTELKNMHIRLKDYDCVGFRNHKDEMIQFCPRYKENCWMIDIPTFSPEGEYFNSIQGTCDIDQAHELLKQFSEGKEYQHLITNATLARPKEV